MSEENWHSGKDLYSKLGRPEEDRKKGDFVVVKASDSPDSSPLSELQLPEGEGDGDEAVSDLTSLDDSAEAEQPPAERNVSAETEEGRTPDGRLIVKAEDARKAAAQDIYSSPGAPRSRLRFASSREGHYGERAS